MVRRSSYDRISCGMANMEFDDVTNAIQDAIRIIQERRRLDALIEALERELKADAVIKGLKQELDKQALLEALQCDSGVGSPVFSKETK